MISPISGLKLLALAISISTILHVPAAFAQTQLPHSAPPDTPQAKQTKEFQRLNIKGAQAAMRGDFDTALQLQKSGLDHARALKQQFWIGVFLTNMANVYEMRGKYDKALEIQLDALRITQKSGNQKAIADRLFNVGTVYTHLKRYDKALYFHMRSLEISHKIHDARSESTSLGNVGYVYGQLAKYDKALEYLNSARAMHEKLKYWQDVAVDYNMMAGVYDARGMADKADDCRQKEIEYKARVDARKP